MLTSPLPFCAVILTCLVVCCLLMVLAWLWARKTANAGVVDIFWALNFPVIGFLLFLLAQGWLPRKIMICLMVVAAGLRLGAHLGVRVISHLDEEEGRYKELRKAWAPHPDRKFFWFFQAQALSNLLLALPFFLTTANTHQGFSPFEYTGLLLWLVSVLGEALADRQLTLFKNDPANRSRVCSTGLWRYSRHPNYFFEWLMWMAYFIFALGSPLGYLAIISPLIILYLLLKVTGIPATEAQSLRSKGDGYRAYQQNTSKFIPWWTKN